jgi:hypothetical protein
LLTYGLIRYNIRLEFGIENFAEFLGVKGNLIRSQNLVILSKGK